MSFGQLMSFSIDHWQENLNVGDPSQLTDLKEFRPRKNIFLPEIHDDVMSWNAFRIAGALAKRIYWYPVDPPHRGQDMKMLMLSL